jgi:hypothetical protein
LHHPYIPDSWITVLIIHNNSGKNKVRGGGETGFLSPTAGFFLTAGFLFTPVFFVYPRFFVYIGFFVYIEDTVDGYRKNIVYLY